MSRAIGPLVDLREGEGRPAALSFVLLTLLIGGHTLLETARDAMFLGKLPASRLAIVYAVIAGVALVVAGPNARLSRRFGEGRALLFTLIVAAAGTLALHVQPLTPTLAFAVYVWSALLATVMVVQFWVFVARVFTPSQGRRLFGPIAAGGVTGAVLGAGGAAAALTYVPVGMLLVGAAGAFLAAAFVALRVDRAAGAAAAAAEPPVSLRERAAAAADASPISYRSRVQAMLPHDEPPPSSRSAGGAPRGLLAVMREHPYIGWVAALTALSTATVLGTDYLFKAEAARRLSPAELGPYFARSYAAFNAAALAVQLLVSGPLVRRVGVARTLVVMPFLLLCGIGGVLVTAAPAAVLLTKGVDGSLRHSLHRVTSELLGLPIPAEVRASAKPVLEGALVRAVQAGMAAVILALSALGGGAAGALPWLVGALAFGWLLAAIGIRRPHLDMFRQALARGSLEVDRPAELDASLIGAAVETLSSPDPARVVAAMELLAESGHPSAIRRSVLAHESEEVRLHALGWMARAVRREWAGDARRLLGPPSTERVRVAAVRALSACRALDEVRRGLADESPAVRAHAAVALTLAEHGGSALTAPLVREILDAAGGPGRAARLALLDAIRDIGDARFSEVVVALDDERDPEMVEHVVPAMASVRDPRFIAALVRRLHVRSSRPAVRDALVALGEPAQGALELAMRSPRTERGVRLHIPRTLSRFGNQRAADFLTEQLAIDPSRLVRYKVLRGLGRLVADNDVRVSREAILGELRVNLVEHLELLSLWVPLEANEATRAGQSGRLVLGLLSDKLHQALERAFRLLHIAYRREDIRRVYLALRSSDRSGRSYAMEFLDALTSGAHGELERVARELLELVVDDLPAPEKVRRAARYLLEAPEDAESALRVLVRDRDTALAALAVYHARELGLGDVLADVEQAARERPSLLDLAGAALRGRAPSPEAAP